jgi:hypothetical protein
MFIQIQVINHLCTLALLITVFQTMTAVIRNLDIYIPQFNIKKGNDFWFGNGDAQFHIHITIKIITSLFQIAILFRSLSTCPLHPRATTSTRS